MNFKIIQTIAILALSVSFHSGMAQETAQEISQLTRQNLAQKTQISNYTPEERQKIMAYKTKVLEVTEALNSRNRHFKTGTIAQAHLISEEQDETCVINSAQ